jgi:hypothetical protein
MFGHFETGIQFEKPIFEIHLLLHQLRMTEIFKNRISCLWNNFISPHSLYALRFFFPAKSLRFHFLTTLLSQPFGRLLITVLSVLPRESYWMKGDHWKPQWSAKMRSLSKALCSRLEGDRKGRRVQLWPKYDVSVDSGASLNYLRMPSIPTFVHPVAQTAGPFCRPCPIIAILISPNQIKFCTPGMKKPKF